MADFVLECLDLLEIPQRRRALLEVRVRRILHEEEIVDPSLIYQTIIKELERVEHIPYAEKFAIRLDGRKRESEQLFHEVVPASVESSSFPGTKEPFFEVDRGLFQQFQRLLPNVEEEMLVGVPLEERGVIQRRLGILEARLQEEKLFLPPERPVREAVFMENDTLVVSLGRRTRGYDSLEFYRKYYPDVVRGELAKRDNALYARLIRQGYIHLIPLLDYGDPMTLYHAKYEGMSPGDLAKADNALYARIRREGLLLQLPRKKRVGRKIYSIPQKEGCS